MDHLSWERRSWFVFLVADNLTDSSISQLHGFEMFDWYTRAWQWYDCKPHAPLSVPSCQYPPVSTLLSVPSCQYPPVSTLLLVQLVYCHAESDDTAMRLSADQACHAQTRSALSSVDLCESATLQVAQLDSMADPSTKDVPAHPSSESCFLSLKSRDRAQKFVTIRF